jgi:GxxExxY protein
MTLKHQALTDQIIGAFFAVYNGLGYGFLEKVYENAFAHELRLCGLQVEQQQRIQVHYHGSVVGEYFSDICVNGLIILELKVAENISDAHTAQLLNYLKATQYEVGFVFNFGPEPAFERRFFSNQKKKHLQ